MSTLRRQGAGGGSGSGAGGYALSHRGGDQAATTAIAISPIATALVLMSWSSRESLSSGDASKNVGNQRATTTWWWHPLV